MKQLFFAFLLLGSVNLLAQDQSSGELKYKREIGVDASSLTRFVPFINLSEAFGPYLVSYRIHKDEKRFIRMDAGLNFGVNFRSNDDNDLTGSFVGANARVGWGKKRNILRNTTLMTGVDVVGAAAFRSNRQFADNGNTSIENKNYTSNYSLGAGPFVGVQYDFTDQLGIYTEASLYAIGDLGRSKSITTSPSGSSESTRYNFALNRSLDLPGKIFVFYKF